MNLTTLTIKELAAVVRKDWQKINYAAAPYLAAMSCLETVSDTYGLDDGKTCVIYFLSNATGWRGETAKAVKAELKRRIK